MAERGQAGMFGGIRRFGEAGGSHARSLRLSQGQRPEQSHSMLCRYHTFTRYYLFTHAQLFCLSVERAVKLGIIIDGRSLESLSQFFTVSRY